MGGGGVEGRGVRLQRYPPHPYPQHLAQEERGGAPGANGGGSQVATARPPCAHTEQEVAAARPGAASAGRASSAEPRGAARPGGV